MTTQQRQRFNELDTQITLAIQENKAETILHLMPEYSALQELQDKETYLLTGKCDHNINIGDNYGESCKVCSERLKGYGYHSNHKDCLHEWHPLGENQICYFCETIQPKEL